MNHLYMPAEWEQHSATQLHWPTNSDIWPGSEIEEMEEMYCNIIEEIHFFEVIHLFVEGLNARNRVMNKLSLKAVDLDRIVIHQIKIDDIWARDCGPIFVNDANDLPVILNWEFNAWGEKYRPYSNDNSLPIYIAEKYGMKCIELGVILEGGSIDVNGDGALLTTESVLMNENRNAELSKDEIEDSLENYLGAGQVIWLKSGLSEDGRNGQVQNVARWLNKDTVLAVITKDESHPDHHILQENLEILEKVKLKNGRPLNIETLELINMNPIQAGTGTSRNLSLSHTGFYFVNGAVIVPQYGAGKKDESIIQVLKKYHPGRKIIPIDCTPLVNTSVTGLHGITQQWRGITY